MRRANGESGSALIIATIIVIIVIGIGGAFLADTVFKQKAVFATMESDEAQLICDAALEKVRRALFVYKSDNTLGWNTILALHLNESIDPDEHSLEYMGLKDSTEWDQYLANWGQPGLNTADEAPMMTDADWFLGPTKPFGKGGFKCIVKDNDDGDGDLQADIDLRILIYITATLPDGTQRQIEALVKYASPTYSPDAAIIVDGNLLLNGSPRITGAVGKTHSNLDTFITGSSVDVDVSVNAVGSVNINGNPSTPPEGFNSGVPTAEIPDIVPSDYFQYADYVLTPTGQITNQSGTVVGSPGVGAFKDFSFSAGKWSVSGNVGSPPGTYYVQGSIKITGQGANVVLRQMTIISEGSIETAGNAKLIAYLPGTLMLSGKDIKLGGTAGASYGSSTSSGSGNPGIIMAHEQVQILGTPRIEGAVIAKDAEDLDATVSSASSIDPDGLGAQTGGSAEIRYDGGLETIVANPNSSVTVENMRRLK